MTPVPWEGPGRVQLPRSSTRAARAYAHVKVLSGVGKAESGAAFEGKIYPPGAVIDAVQLGRGVALECVGPVDPRPGKRPEILWILWQWSGYNEAGEGEWRELGRAAAVNWEWAVALRGMAERALYPDPELLDVMKLGRELAEGIVQAIEAKLEKTPESLRKSVVSALYDRLGGKLAG